MVKVCGLKIQQNLDAVIDTGVRMIGFNYYPPSKRYLDHTLQIDYDEVQKVGVFVNASIETITSMVKRDDLQYAQLHGDESIAFCRSVQEFVKVIKVFRVNENFDFKTINSYSFCDLFLFDTYTDDYGGSGKKFDWNSLQGYEGDTPFLLSGGIGPESVEALKDFKHSSYIGVDINSKFEIEPGVKDVDSIQTFINEYQITKLDRI